MYNLEKCSQTLEVDTTSECYASCLSQEKRIKEPAVVIIIKWIYVLSQRLCISSHLILRTTDKAVGCLVCLFLIYLKG
jgi:hypothetical protein